MLELCDTTLKDHIKKNFVSEEELCKYGLQVLEGLCILH